MKSIGFMYLNIWWLDETTDPLKTAKDQMVKDGYWEDCDITDDLLSSEMEVVRVSDATYNCLKTGHDALRAMNIIQSDSQMWASYQTMLCIAKANMQPNS